MLCTRPPSTPTLSQMLGLDWSRTLKYASGLVWRGRCTTLPEACLHCYILPVPASPWHSQTSKTASGAQLDH